MFLSRFDSSIDLDAGKAAVVLFCSQDHGKKEQHAIIAVELKANNQYQLYTLDFYPASKVNDNLYGNGSIYRWEDKIRDGEVRVRTSPLAVGTTKEQLLTNLHISDGLLRNYRVGAYDTSVGSKLIQNARAQLPPNAPKFRYSGLCLENDVPELKIFNCLTWAKTLMDSADIEIARSVFASSLESSGETAETGLGLNIPKVHTVETGSWCNIM